MESDSFEFVVLAAVLATLIATVVIVVVRAVHAQDRTPIKVRDATPTTSVAAADGPDLSLPPSFTFETLPTSPRPDAWRDTAGYISWALRNGGVHVHRLNRRFTIRGTEDGPVRLDRVAVKVLERRPPVRGFTLDTAAGGDSADRYVWADLDDVDAAGYARTEQTVDRFDAASGELVTHRWSLVKVSRTDVETFVVVALTDRYDCDFEIEIHYHGEHKSGKVVANHDGKPFRVSALSENPHITYVVDDRS
jgi:hypothetical protein